MSGVPVTVKIGGTAADADGALAAIAAHADPSCVVVHGGGHEVDAWSARLGIERATHDGLRVTDAPTMEVVAAVLAGLVNTRLVAALAAAGRPAVGLTGVDAGLLAIDPAPAALGLVGIPRLADPTLLERLIAGGLLPVVAPIAADDHGTLRNVNADAAAAAIASARGGRLLLCTDVPAVQRGGVAVEALSVDEVEALLASGDATAGMRPKLRAAITAAGAGCEVLILDGRSAAVLRTALAGDHAGTRIGPSVAAVTRSRP